MTPQLWVTLIVALISACVGPVCVYMFKRDIDKRDAKAKQVEEDEKQKKAKEHADLVNEISGLIKPVADEVSDIKKDVADQGKRLEKVEKILKDNEEATILELRVDIKSIRDRKVLDDKELDTGDMATFKEIFKKYYKMGGNHFKEYVDGWAKDIGLTPKEIIQLKEEAEAEKQAELDK